MVFLNPFNSLIDKLSNCPSVDLISSSSSSFPYSYALSFKVGLMVSEKRFFGVFFRKCNQRF